MPETSSQASSNQVQRITRDKLAGVFDRRIAPVAYVNPGETFIVETEDSRGGLTRTAENTTPEFLWAMRRRPGFFFNPVYPCPGMRLPRFPALLALAIPP
ncbi:MAG: hypothetical protein DMG05_17535 [Acidobacteria bacterium]|nr:MAG: hypothetical protein DMG05_17535 [Acidobacteriota bacterium]